MADQQADKMLTPEQMARWKDKWLDWPYRVRRAAAQEIWDSHEGLRAQLAEAQVSVRALAEAGERLAWEVDRGRFATRGELVQTTHPLRIALARPDVVALLEKAL